MIGACVRSDSRTLRYRLVLLRDCGPPLCGPSPGALPGQPLGISSSPAMMQLDRVSGDLKIVMGRCLAEMASLFGPLNRAAVAPAGPRGGAILRSPNTGPINPSVPLFPPGPLLVRARGGKSTACWRASSASELKALLENPRV